MLKFLELENYVIVTFKTDEDVDQSPRFYAGAN
jgi:hypothetical protein